MALSVRLGTVLRHVRRSPIGPRFANNPSPMFFEDGVGIATPLLFGIEGIKYGSFASRTAMRTFHSASRLLVMKDSCKVHSGPPAVRLYSQANKDNCSGPKVPEPRHRRYHLFGTYTLEEFKEKEGKEWLDSIFQTATGKFMMNMMRPLMEYSEIVEESSKHPRYKYLVDGAHTLLSWVKYVVLISLGPWLKKVFDDFRGKTKRADDRLQVSMEMKRQLEQSERQIQERDMEIQKLQREAEIEKRDKQIEKLERDILALKVAVAMSPKNYSLANIVQAVGPEDLKPTKDQP